MLWLPLSTAKTQLSVDQGDWKRCNHCFHPRQQFSMWNFLCLRSCPQQSWTLHLEHTFHSFSPISSSGTYPTHACLPESALYLPFSQKFYSFKKSADLSPRDPAFWCQGPSTFCLHPDCSNLGSRQTSPLFFLHFIFLISSWRACHHEFLAKALSFHTK